MEEIISFLRQNKIEILIFFGILFLLSLFARAVQRIMSRNQQSQYEQSLQQFSFDYNRPSNEVIKDKFITHFFKFAVSTIAVIIVAFLLYYISEQLWPIESGVD